MEKDLFGGRYLKLKLFGFRFWATKISNFISNNFFFLDFLLNLARIRL